MRHTTTITAAAAFAAAFATFAQPAAACGGDGWTDAQTDRCSDQLAAATAAQVAKALEERERARRAQVEAALNQSEAAFRAREAAAVAAENAWPENANRQRDVSRAVQESWDQVRYITAPWLFDPEYDKGSGYSWAKD